MAVETVDLQLARLARAVEELEGILVVTADHGNADEMYQHAKDGKVQRHKQTGELVCSFERNMLIPARGEAVEDKIDSY